jgi:hypothetical protein
MQHRSFNPFKSKLPFSMMSALIVFFHALTLISVDKLEAGTA